MFFYDPVVLGSGGAVFNAYGSDLSRAPSVGNPVSIPAPTITSVSSVPEPSALYLLGGSLAMMLVLGRRLPGLAGKRNLSGLAFGFDPLPDPPGETKKIGPPGETKKNRAVGGNFAKLNKDPMNSGRQGS